MSVRWSSCSSRWRSRRSRAESSLRRARASSSASRWRRSFSSFASRISSFWRARASASIRRASAWAAFIDCEAQLPRASMPSTAPPTAAITATAMRTSGSISVLPSGRRPTGGCCASERLGRERWGRVRGARLGDAPPGHDRCRVLVVALLGQRSCCLRLAYGRAAPGVKRRGNEAGHEEAAPHARRRSVCSDGQWLWPLPLPLALALRLAGSLALGFAASRAASRASFAACRGPPRGLPCPAWAASLTAPPWLQFLPPTASWTCATSRDDLAVGVRDARSVAGSFRWSPSSAVVPSSGGVASHSAGCSSVGGFFGRLFLGRLAVGVLGRFLGICLRFRGLAVRLVVGGRVARLVGDAADVTAVVAVRAAGAVALGRLGDRDGAVAVKVDGCLGCAAAASASACDGVVAVVVDSVAVDDPRTSASCRRPRAQSDPRPAQRSPSGRTPRPRRR